MPALVARLKGEKRMEMRTIFHVVVTPDGLDLRGGEKADLPDLSVVLITLDVPVSRLIDEIPELRELVSTLTRERDEARAEVEKLRAVVQDLCEVLDECVYDIDTRYGGPPGSNNIDRELIERAQAAMAKAKGET